MANNLKMDLINTIGTLRRQGWSKRRIARELKIDRQTVRKYLAADSKSSTPSSPVSERLDQNHPFSTAGSEADSIQNHPVSTPGDGELSQPPDPISASKPGRPSSCAPHLPLIQEKLGQELTAQRIYQDLVSEVDFHGSYQAVKRFVRQLKPRLHKLGHRVEVLPGEEAQVDFGSGAPVIGEKGRRRKPWVFRIVLSYSRKAYSEAVWHQNTETFIRCLENAFRHFNGVTLILNLDNLKAAVSRADWYDPELNPKLESFCRHYGTCLMPCRPRKAEHKGKVERNISYLKSNALKGRTFSSLAQENAFMANWERTVADQRIHGTTRKQVAALFTQEKAALLPLPSSLFPYFQEAPRTVHPDGYVQIDHAYYRMPPEHSRHREVWARWDSRCVRLFSLQWEQLLIHTKLPPGKFSRVLGIGGGNGSLEQNLAYWLKRASELGQPCAQWAKGLVEQRGPTAMRTLMGLINLSHHHSFKALNEACARALANGAWRLRDLRHLLRQPGLQTQFEFAQTHPLIRDLGEYGDFIQNQK